jgi:hypothetical protein
VRHERPDGDRRVARVSHSVKAVLKPEQRLTRFARRMSPLGEVGRTLTAILTASASMFALPAGTGVEVYWPVYWDVWALPYLTLTWFLILRSRPGRPGDGLASNGDRPGEAS